MAGSLSSPLLRLLLFSSTLLLVFAQSGFLSIDCGGNKSYVDSQTEIKWVPDGNYTNAGFNSKVANQTVSKALRTLRYFPNGNGSNCYALPVQRGQRYFFRASFLYGNYDGKDYWPSFNLSFDGGNWTHNLVGSNYLSNQTVTEELIFPPRQTTTANLCLTTDDSVNNVPFISSLELRPLPTRFYNQSSDFGNAYLHLTRRRYFNADANAIVRYPHDNYDRNWLPRSYIPDYANRISSNVTINTTSHGNEAPIQVLRTALEGKDINSVFNYTFSMGEVNSDLLFFFYFSELRYDRKITDVREFNMVVSNDNGKSTGPLAIKLGPNATLSGFFWGQWGTSTDATFTFSLVPTSNSTLPPILNAFEIFRYNEGAALQGSSPPPPSPPMSNPPPASPSQPPPSPPPLSPPPPPPQQSSIQDTKRPILCFVIPLILLFFV